MKNAIRELHDNNISCPVCLDEIKEDNLSITSCGHKFCWDCITNIYDSQNTSLGVGKFKCPFCNTIIFKENIYSKIDSPSLGNIENDNSTYELTNLINKTKSSKIGNIIYFLKNEIKKTDKVILFSQWDELLHKVGDIISKYLHVVYCNGSVFQRKRSIDEFTSRDDINVLLLSSKNAASGTNLTVANKIIFLEPIYGSSDYRINTESQAIGRADRIGQLQEIQIYKFIIRDTIEEEVLNNSIQTKIIK
mgnify:FL=1